MIINKIQVKFLIYLPIISRQNLPSLENINNPSDLASKRPAQASFGSLNGFEIVQYGEWENLLSAVRLSFANLSPSFAWKD